MDGIVLEILLTGLSDEEAYDKIKALKPHFEDTLGLTLRGKVTVGTVLDTTGHYAHYTRVNFTEKKDV